MEKTISNIFFLLIIIISGSSNLSGQNSDTLSLKKGKKGIMFSVEPFLYYPYYFAHSNPDIYHEKINYKNYWNYGGGILIFNHIGKLRVSTGFYLSTKNYYRDNNVTTLIDKINYWNIPIIFSLNSVHKVKPFIGFIFNKPYFYNNTNNSELIKEIGDSTGLSHANISGGTTLPFLDFLTGYTLKIGCSYKVKVIKRFQLNIKIFCDYKLKQDVGFLKNIYYQVKNPSDYELISIASGRIMIGLGIGCEIFSNKYYQK